MVGDLIEGLTNVPGPLICLIIGLLAAAETAAFIGLAAPGELSVVFGGVLAFQGAVSLPAITASAIGGAIAGDSLGFYLGRRFGGRLTEGRLGRLMGVERVDRTMARIRAGGIKAIILGRFVGVLRAVMPFAAGASGLRYGRFLVASVIGASAWGTFFTLAGYLAGDQWRRVEHYAGRASTVIAIVLVGLVVIVLVAKKAMERQDRLLGAWARFLARPRVAAFRHRYRGQIAFLVGRFRPGGAFGLQLTVSLLGAAVLGYLLAVLIGQVLDLAGLAGFDRTVRRALSGQPRAAVDIMETVRSVLSPAGAAVVAVLAGLVAWVRDRRPRALTMLLLAVVGGYVLADVVSALVERPNPLISDPLPLHTFPAVATTTITATAIALLAVVVPRVPRWHLKVAVTAAVLALVFVAGVAEVFVDRAFLSDAVGGLALGALWGTAATTAVTTLWRPPRRRTDPAPSETLGERILD